MADPSAVVRRQFLSYVVFSPEEMVFPEHFLMLGEGVNAFNLSLQDPEGFRKMLQDRGVRIVEVHRLDDHEAIQPDPGIFLEAMASRPLLGG